VQKIAVLGSRQSAGYDDFMHTLAQNPYRYQFDVDTYHVAVQGEDKARQLFEQLLEIFKSGKVYDAVVIIRGGGSESDFLIFNDYNLNRAIAKFPIPVITGIGHLKDQSIADLMAHTETKTPTKAAEYIIAHNKMFEDRIMVLQKHLVFKAQQICSSRQRVLSNINTVVVNKSRDYLQHYNQTLVKLNQLVTQRSVQILHQRKNDLLNISGAIVVQPKIQVAKRRHEIDMQVNNLHTFRIQFIKQQVNQLQHLASMIRMASPEQTLKRGFALVKHQGKVIRDADGLKEQEELTIVMQHTEIKTVIKEIAENHERPYNI
jgi:exodeoxyribonuclease VII large subunit